MNLQKEREMFEAWVGSNGRNIERFSDGSYKSMTLDKEWEAWQAAKAQAVSEIQQDKQAEIDDLKAQLLLFQADTKRIDFLADKSQNVANVMLPSKIVERNISSLRDAIDEAMMIEEIEHEK